MKNNLVFLSTEKVLANKKLDDNVNDITLYFNN